MEGVLTEPKGRSSERAFYGAQCPSYPACNGGCGLGCRHEIEAPHEDMASVGRAFMDAIEQARTSDPWVKAWAPLQCPSEIIFDLLNHFDEQRARAERPAAFLAWAVETFGPVAKLRSERLMRFVEEAIELAQAEGMELSTLDRIASRVYSQPAGSVSKEIAQAQVCLETLSEVLGESASALAEKEFERVRSIPREEWIRRHAAKQAIGIAEPAHG